MVDPKQIRSYHILIALQSFDAGGAERQAIYLATGLQQLGYSVTVLAFGKSHGLTWNRCQELGITAVATGFRDTLLLPARLTLKYFLLKWKYTALIISQIRRVKADIIIPFTYQPNFIFGQWWKVMGVKACFWNQRDEGRLFKGIRSEINVLENSAEIISNSREGIRFLEKYTSRKINLIPNGIDLEKFQLRVKTGTERIKIIMVANLHSKKDHHTLLEAWKIIIEDLEVKNVELLLVGKEGNSAEAIKAYVRNHNLIDTVFCLGQTEDVSAVLSTCDIAVHSSFNEGVPNAILESMAMGLPVVATRISGSMEALGKEYDFLCARENADEMAKKLVELIGDEGLRKSVGERNKKRVQEFFGLERMINSYHDLICKNIQ